MKIHQILFYVLVLLLPTQLGKHFWPDFAFVAGVRVDYLAPTVFLTDIVMFGMLAFWILEQKKKLLWIKKTQIITSFVLEPFNVTRHSGKRSASRIPSGVLRAGRSWTSQDDADETAKRVIVWILGISMVVLFNILNATSPMVAIVAWITILKLFLVALYIVKTKPNLPRTITWLTIGGIYSCIIAWVQLYNQASIGGVLWFLGERTFTIQTPGIALIDTGMRLVLRPYATFPHPNVLAGYLTILLPLLLFQKPFKQQWLLAIRKPVILLFLMTIIATFSRSAWIVSYLLILTYVILVKQSMWRTIAVLAGSSLIVLYVIPGMFNRATLLFSGHDESLTIRMQSIGNTIAMVKDHPTGVGLNNYIVALTDYQLIKNYQYLQPVHSIYLLIAAETGIIGILLLLFMVRFVIRNARAFVSKPKQALFFSIITIPILGLFDHYPVTIHQTRILCAVIVGLFLNSSSHATIKPHRRMFRT